MIIKLFPKLLEFNNYYKLTKIALNKLANLFDNSNENNKKFLPILKKRNYCEKIKRNMGLCQSKHGNLHQKGRLDQG